MKGSETAMFDAEDWLARLKEAGGTVRIDAVKMWPAEGNINRMAYAFVDGLRRKVQNGKMTRRGAVATLKCVRAYAEWSGLFDQLDMFREHDRGIALSPECEAIWAEIRGPENVDKWRQVEELVRARIGPFVGWAAYGGGAEAPLAKRL
jgi:hypothetical protein